MSPNSSWFPCWGSLLFISILDNYFAHHIAIRAFCLAEWEVVAEATLVDIYVFFR